MKTCIALLRGINVGRAKRISMAELRAVFKALGYRDVRTLLNSGNVVFTPPARAMADPAGRIEAAIASQLGVSARVTVISAADLAESVAANPLVNIATDPSRSVVTFLQDPADLASLAPLLAREWSPEAFALGRQVAYAWCPQGILASKVLDAANRILRDRGTTRNWATVLKLHALATPPA